jgi:hypothetical protein
MTTSTSTICCCRIIPLRLLRKILYLVVGLTLTMGPIVTVNVLSTISLLTFMNYDGKDNFPSNTTQHIKVHPNQQRNKRQRQQEQHNRMQQQKQRNRQGQPKNTSFSNSNRSDETIRVKRSRVVPTVVSNSMTPVASDTNKIIIGTKLVVNSTASTMDRRRKKKSIPTQQRKTSRTCPEGSISALQRLSWDNKFEHVEDTVAVYSTSTFQKCYTGVNRTEHTTTPKNERKQRLLLSRQRNRRLKRKISSRLQKFKENKNDLKDSNNHNNENPKTAAVCYFRHEMVYSTHFPHAMQQLYRCLSWWLLYSHQPDIPKILVYENKQNRRHLTNPFLSGIFQSFHEILNVTIMSHQDFHATKNHSLHYYVQLRGYRSYCMLSPKTDAYNYRNMMIRHYPILRSSLSSPSLSSRILSLPTIIRNSSITATSENDINDNMLHSQQDAHHNRLGIIYPRIGILNRTPMDGRNIKNVRELQQAIQNEMRRIISETTTSTVSLVSTNTGNMPHHLRHVDDQNLNHHSYHDRTKDNNYNVTVEYFSNKTFLQQVLFYISHDIVISPHGAQLTALPFLASSTSCNMIIEIFPNGYRIPHYFGSLAYYSNIKHAFFDITSGRTKAKDLPMCLPIYNITQSIIPIIMEWQQCYYDYYAVRKDQVDRFPQ